MMRPLPLFVAAILLCACAAPETAKPETEDQAPPALWRFENAAADLRAASCPEGVSFERGADLPITATEIDLGEAGEGDLAGLTLVGGWHLTADNELFGGLSGLAVQRSGSLLSMSDAGTWVWIGIDPETGTPDGLGSFAQMRDDEGEISGDKIARDSEGLALREGLALVSFEQNHRIEAFDLEGCGSAARGVLVAALQERAAGVKIPDNQGAEGLALDDAGFLSVGFEVRGRAGSPVGILTEEGALTDLQARDEPYLYRLTGLDRLGDLSAEIYRAYDPVRGARVILSVRDQEIELARAHLRRKLPVDNFEGVAFGTNPEGGTRVWLISDDNFSSDQRTLLLAFDLD